MTPELEDISGIGKATAERIRAAGIDSVKKLAEITPEEFLKLNIKGIGDASAHKYIETAKELLEEMGEVEHKDKVEEPKKEQKEKPLEKAIKAEEKKKVSKQKKEAKAQGAG